MRRLWQKYKGPSILGLMMISTLFAYQNCVQLDDERLSGANTLGQSNEENGILINEEEFSLEADAGYQWIMAQMPGLFIFSKNLSDVTQATCHYRLRVVGTDQQGQEITYLDIDSEDRTDPNSRMIEFEGDLSDFRDVLGLAASSSRIEDFGLDTTSLQLNRFRFLILDSQGQLFNSHDYAAAEVNDPTIEAFLMEQCSLRNTGNNGGS